MVDFASVYNLANKPTVALENPLDIRLKYQQLQGMQQEGQINSLKLQQANQSMGEAMKMKQELSQIKKPEEAMDVLTRYGKFKEAEDLGSAIKAQQTAKIQFQTSLQQYGKADREKLQAINENVGNHAQTAMEVPDPQKKLERWRSSIAQLYQENQDEPNDSPKILQAKDNIRRQLDREIQTLTTPDRIDAVLTNHINMAKTHDDWMKELEVKDPLAKLNQAHDQGLITDEQFKERSHLLSSGQPLVQVFGPPSAVTDIKTGQPKLIQTDKSGNVKEVEGYSPLAALDDVTKFAHTVGAVKQNGKVDIKNKLVQDFITKKNYIPGSGQANKLPEDPFQPLPSKSEEMIAQQVAIGKFDMLPMSRKDPTNARINVRANAIAIQNGDTEGLDQAIFKNRRDALRFYTIGRGGDSFRQQEVILHHIDKFREIANLLNNGKVQLANKIGNEFGVQFGSDQVTNFRIAGAILSAEVGSYLAKGPGTKDERSHLEEKIPDFSSPKAFNGALDTLDSFVNAQRAAWTRQKEANLRGKVVGDLPKEIVQIKNDAEWFKLKKGTNYMGPDGVVRVK